MGTIISYVLHFAVSVVLIGCPVSYIYMALRDPVRFARLTGPGHHPFGHRAWFGASLLGVAIFVYSGVAFLLAWIPHSWVRHDNVQGLAGFTGLIGSISLLSGLNKFVHSAVELERDNVVLHRSFDHIRKQIESLDYRISKGQPTEAIGEILDQLETETRKARVGAEPSLRLTKVMRRMAGLPDREPIPERGPERELTSAEKEAAAILDDLHKEALEEAERRKSSMTGDEADVEKP